MNKIGLALGGGGARGLCHIEFLKVFDRLNIKPTIISGTSIGSIIGAFYASGISGEEIASLAKNLNFLEISKLLDFSFFHMSGLIKGDGVMNFLKENIKVNTFSELEIPLKIIATDFWHRKEIVLETGELIPAIRASISIPGLFNPVKMGNKILTDGGAANPLPYDVIQDNCDFVIAIDVNGEKSPEKEKKNPTIFESVMNTFQIMEACIVEHKMKINKPHLYIKPTLNNIELLDFQKHKKIMSSVQYEVDVLTDFLSSL